MSAFTRTWCALCILTWEMCFAPQRRALFRHRNFQKWSDISECLYILPSKCASRHMACTFFRSSQLTKVVRDWCVLYILPSKCASRHNGVHFFRHLNFQKWSASSSVLSILTWKCASRHNGVHFFMSHLASWLRTRRFSEPTFRPSSLEKHGESRLSYLFAHLHLLLF